MGSGFRVEGFRGSGLRASRMSGLEAWVQGMGFGVRFFLQFRVTGGFSLNFHKKP